MDYNYEKPALLEMYHHGIIGQKWGVRRYQNEDGTLTDAGKKRYNSMSDEKLYKTLKKEVRDKRGELYGKANRWESGKPIGDNSKSIINASDKKRKQYESSKEYTDWFKKYKKLETKFNKGDYDNDPEKYEKELQDLIKLKPKKNFDDVREFAIVYGKNGREYVNDYLNKGGKDMTMSYLKDLGYSDEVAENFTNRLIRGNRTLGIV